MASKHNIFFWLLVLLFTMTVQDASGENISGRLASGRYGWQYGYDLQVDNGRLHVLVGIHLVAAPGVTRSELNRVQPEWEKEIERVWSNRFALVYPDGFLPIVIDVRFKGHNLQHDVIVLPGGGRKSDELTWHVMDTPQTAAHEFGHMLGLYDEYVGGARDPRGKVYDPDSIMTSCPVAGKSRIRHYERFRQWYMKKTGQQDVRLQAMPE